MPIPDTPDTRYDMASYKASARALDQGMGLVFDALDKAGLAENTLVICTTDHGLAFPEMKCNLTQHGIGTMLIMRGPAGFEGGQVSDALVSHVDLFPTICEVVGVEAPEWLQGNSLMPLIRGEAEEINDEVFGEVTYHAAYEPKRTIRTREYAYIRRFGDRPVPTLPNCDDSLTKNIWLKHDFAERTIPFEQLYDLTFDPTETHNLAGDPDMAPILNRMRARLQSWMERTGDPLLQGEPVPAPSGARVNPVNGISPREPVEILD